MNSLSNSGNASDVTHPLPRKGLHEDWAASLIGLSLMIIAFASVAINRPSDITWKSSKEEVSQFKITSALKATAWKAGDWDSNPLQIIRAKPKEGQTVGDVTIVPLLWSLLITGVIGAVATVLFHRSLPKFLLAFPVLFLLALFAYGLSSQSVIKYYNLEYALWALMVGLIISNTVGTPRWLKPAILGEFYIKTGLVLLGMEVLFGRLLELGLPGIFVSWVVTPIVLVGTFFFGQKILKIKSKSLNMVISADMSVCGVSAAIATAAACKAKREELSLAIGLSLGFTVIMMVVMPRVVLATGLDPVVAGAWIGGTIDATGAVAAAGEAIGEKGEKVAVTVKMIQNILIGVIAFAVAVIWAKWVENEGDETKPAIGVGEIWRRFPKFVLGFLTASIVCSVIYAASPLGGALVDGSIDGFTKHIRGWLFCLAFVCIGLDTNFRELLPYFRTGKPLVLYVCGQAFNLLLTFLMAYLMYGILFKE